MYKLRELRQKQNLTLTELSKRADVSKQTISDIERSEHDTTIQMLIRLSLALGVTPNDVIGWEDIINEQKEGRS